MYDGIDILDIDQIDISDNLIDIRDKYEYMLGHISQSINIPYNYLMMNPENYLEHDKIYYLYCDKITFLLVLPYPYGFYLQLNQIF